MHPAELSRADFLSVLFRMHHDWLYDRIRRRVRCPHHADDLAAETFAQVVALPDPGAIHEPRAFLTTIAHRLLLETWRRRDLERAYIAALAALPEPVYPSPEERAMVLETLLAIDRLLDNLSPKARAAFLYSQLEGLTYAEIAARLGVSVSRVRQYLAQALKRCYEAGER
jgi:RNA polymerase sigma-70 factor (ECF subfamily)